MYEYDFSGILNDCNGFTTSEIALTFTFPASGKVPAQPGIGVSLSRPGTSSSTENRLCLQLICVLPA
ncbi:hypothetical protein HMPREF3191_01073 [Veillonellaceae bacterium DNF00626]|nr:hypothetical protein HMPREF3191_01073 [Veillonellaceae bacterium DNF00626]